MQTTENLDFEHEWTKLGREICQAIYIIPRIQELKHSLQKNGSMTMAENGDFIELCNKTKYDLIYAKYGPDKSPGYITFSKAWQAWFEGKGVGSSMNRGQRNSVEHILFGSTPDPTQFLLHFEEEMLGSMQEGKGQ